VVIPAQGDVWWAEAAGKRRPVLIVTRSEAVPVLDWVIVAPVTRTIRNIPTEVALDQRDGLPTSCVATFDNLQPIRKAFLAEYIGSIRYRRADICAAFSAMADC
jgi:mRNA interferase MazF